MKIPFKRPAGVSDTEGEEEEEEESESEEMDRPPRQVSPCC